MIDTIMLFKKIQTIFYLFLANPKRKRVPKGTLMNICHGKQSLTTAFRLSPLGFASWKVKTFRRQHIQKKILYTLRPGNRSKDQCTQPQAPSSTSSTSSSRLSKAWVESSTGEGRQIQTDSLSSLFLNYKNFCVALKKICIIFLAQNYV